MKSGKKRLVFACAVNLAIVLMEIVSAIMGFALRWNDYHLKALLFYTQDSNLFALVACGAMAYAQLQCLQGKRSAPSKVVQRMKYMAACALSLTFLVVLFVLVPLAGWQSITDKLFADTKLYHHFLCPLLTAGSFILLEDYSSLTKKDAGFATIPTVCYAIILTILNILQIADGPYPYLRVYEQPVWASVLWRAVILGSAYGIAKTLLWMNHRLNRQ